MTSESRGCGQLNGNDLINVDATSLEPDLRTLPLQTQGELLANHGIDPTLFVSWSIHLGPSDDYRAALEDEAREKALRTTHGQTGTRATIWKRVRDTLALAEGGWSMYSVRLNRHGLPATGKAFLAHRIHPRRRYPGLSMKVDNRGWHPVNRGLCLPPFSEAGAQQLLAQHGFTSPEKGFEPWLAWDFILRSPHIPVWIEESALKAYAACSIGQIAIGINGIYGACQKGRGDRLHPILKKLSKGRRRITVRFDRPETERSGSVRAAQALARKLEKAGAEASWWCWLPGMPGKTDNFIGAIARRELPESRKCWLDVRVTTEASRRNYCRIRGNWTREVIDREFIPEDVVRASARSRVVTLKGATGTAKSKAFVGALQMLEDQLGQKLIVLGAYHRASLVHKGAREFGVVDMSAIRNTPERDGLHEGQTLRSGLFCCGESAAKESNEITLWRWYWDLKEAPRPTVLILDEISQVLGNWTMGGTEALKKIRGKALTALEGLIQLECVRVWAADALIGDVELDWLQGLSKQKPILVQSTFTRPRTLYKATTSTIDKLILQQALGSVAKSEARFWLGCGTRSTLNKLMDALPAASEGTELRVTGDEESREDPRIMRLMADTEGEGPLYQRVGFSPSISCGISLAGTEVALSAVVQEYAWAAEDVLQALNRARNSRTRILLAPAAVPDAAGLTKETTPDKAATAFSDLMKAGAVVDYIALLADRHPATLQAIARLEARRNLEAFNNDWCLTGLMAEEGYAIKPLADLEIGGDGVDEQSADRERQLQSMRTPEGIELYRMEALQRLVDGTSTLESEQARAKAISEGGAFLDLAEVDVSTTWQAAQELGLVQLARTSRVHPSSTEITNVWSALGQLDQAEAKQFARALGTRPDRMPGPQDPLEVRTIWSLLKTIGFEAKKSGRTRSEGTRWTITRIPTEIAQEPPCTI